MKTANEFETEVGKALRRNLQNRFRVLQARCNSPKHNRYAIYGGRGIKCLWRSFKEFEADMYTSFHRHVKKYGLKNTQIDRIDFNGDYCKENCRWATLREQSRNKRNIKKYTYKGKTHTLTEWSEITGINFFALYRRLVTSNWPLSKALSTEKHINQYL